jgi:ABC-type transport system substrate-binding protein
VFFLRKPSKVENDAETATKIASFLDWNLTPAGPIADEARTLQTERLVDVGSDGRYIYRLAASVEKDKDSGETDIKAIVKIKDSIYWSDQAQLTAQQFVDAWQRYKDWARANPELMDVDGSGPWVKNLSVSAPEKLTLEITGLANQDDITNFVRSRFLLPIRKDLLDAPDTAATAWLVTIGRYHLAALPPETVTSSSELEFVPNPSYYRGAASETVKVAIGKLATSP